MSLRSELHDALDEVTPPAPALEGKVTTFVVAHDRRRGIAVLGRARAPWTNRFRGTLTMVAAVLVVVLIGAIILGGRYLRDMSAPPATVNQAELKSLEGRPLNFPVVGPGAQCPATPIAVNRDVGMVIGDGPFYWVNGDLVGTSTWGAWFSASFIYPAPRDGLVLIRAKDLSTGQTTSFAQYPLAPSGVTATGSVVGSDHVLDRTLQMRREAIVQDPSHTRPIDKKGDLPPLTAMYGVPKGSSGCVAFQIDGPGFTENFVVDVSGHL